MQEPVALAEGDRVSVTLKADLVDGDYLWRWDTRVATGGDPESVKASFRQSAFYGAPVSLDSLKRREQGFVPGRPEAVEIDQFALARMDGRTSLGEIAAALAARFPQRFPRRQDTLTYIADLAERYRRS